MKFRARKGAVPAQIRGNTRLEVGWTVAAAVILVGLAVVTFAKLVLDRGPAELEPGRRRSSAAKAACCTRAPKKLPPNGKALNITVIGRQYIWQYIYPGANEPDGLGAPYSYEEMVVPTKRPSRWTSSQTDVVHSWWIPELGGKFQAVPGYHNYTWFKIEKPGDLPRAVRVPVRPRPRAHDRDREAVPPAQFEAWLAYQKQMIHEANAASARGARATRRRLRSEPDRSKTPRTTRRHR